MLLTCTYCQIGRQGLWRAISGVSAVGDGSPANLANGSLRRARVHARPADESLRKVTLGSHGTNTYKGARCGPPGRVRRRLRVNGSIRN
jgi:hypothetical protein